MAVGGPGREADITAPGVAVGRPRQACRALSNERPLLVAPAERRVRTIDGEAGRVPGGCVACALEIDLGQGGGRRQPEHHPAVAADHAVGGVAEGVRIQVLGGRAVEGVDRHLKVGVDSQRRIVL